ncbi:MAG TPA: hypothetical protein VHZ54_00875 [Solirubrobacterales bacterium]|nr:hypothetical protein [Solirubrobacterales bacterium]
MRRGIVAVICLIGAVWLGAAAGSAAAASPPANDDFANAEPAVVPLSLVMAENEGATAEPGEPTAQGIPGGASVWFDWTPEESGGAEFTACWGIGERALVGVYTGEAVGALTPAPRIFGAGGCEYGFQAIAGVTYRIQVEGGLDPATGAPTTGVAQLDLRRFPANDDFEDAVDLGDWTSVGSASETGNLGATKQPGEPDHDGDPGGSSVWFTWTAPATGEAQIAACYATFTPLLAAYTGTDVAALTPVAAAAGEPGVGCGLGPSGAGQLNFHAVAGTRYDLAVDGRGGASGTFDLSLAMDNRTLEALAGEPQPTGPPPLPPVGRIIVSRAVDSTARTAVFSLGSGVPGSTFRCRLDHRAYKPCGAKITYRHLAFGHHAFHADVSAADLTDHPAATATFKIARPHHRRG